MWATEMRRPRNGGPAGQHVRILGDAIERVRHAVLSFIVAHDDHGAGMRGTCRRLVKCLSWLREDRVPASEKL